MPPSPTSRLSQALTRMQWRRGLRAGVVVTDHRHRLPPPRHAHSAGPALGGFLVHHRRQRRPLPLPPRQHPHLPHRRLPRLLRRLHRRDEPPAQPHRHRPLLLLRDLARVLTQPLASSSVAILVCYIVAYGPATSTFTAASPASSTSSSAASGPPRFSLFLWPADPFRPARNAVADALLHPHPPRPPAPPSNRHPSPVTTPQRARHAQLRLHHRSRPGRPRRHSRPHDPPAPSAPATSPSSCKPPTSSSPASSASRSSALRLHQPTPAPPTRQALAQWLVASLARHRARPPRPSRRRRTPPSLPKAHSPSTSIVRALHFETSLDPNALDAAPTLAAQLDAQLAAVERDCLLSTSK